jgi:hypothetical protein
VRAGDGDSDLCEFAITLAEDWRGCGLATQLIALPAAPRALRRLRG